ncbi:MAG: hypothetical protein JSU69_02485 [Candidatus Zixiibacteriota bacterium]|nr:MAG: hypothetical protein JSU69_02485 [candidate division Zixibacteria bacterium]
MAVRRKKAKPKAKTRRRAKPKARAKAKPKTRARKAATGKAWTALEIQKLRTGYKKKPASQIAKELRRSLASVRGKISALKLTKGPARRKAKPKTKAKAKARPKKKAKPKAKARRRRRR